MNISNILSGHLELQNANYTGNDNNSYYETDKENYTLEACTENSFMTDQLKDKLLEKYGPLCVKRLPDALNVKNIYTSKFYFTFTQTSINIDFKDINMTIYSIKKNYDLISLNWTYYEATYHIKKKTHTTLIYYTRKS